MFTTKVIVVIYHNQSQLHIFHSQLSWANPCGCGWWWGQPFKSQSIFGWGLRLEENESDYYPCWLLIVVLIRFSPQLSPKTLTLKLLSDVTWTWTTTPGWLSMLSRRPWWGKGWLWGWLAFLMPFLKKRNHYHYHDHDHNHDHNHN